MNDGTHPVQQAGSSPLTRGKPGCKSGENVGSGLIPAHAGKTVRHVEVLSISRAHPRSRGENVGWTVIPIGGSGSSPLTRGKPFGSPGMGTPQRLIPAHAGKTGFKAGDDIASGAHPRSRGENPVPRRTTTRTRGSSPLTRGKRCPPGSARGRSGLIPAHAGKTKAPPPETITTAAHPRSRGENVDDLGDAVPDCGSSPLTRGKPWARA